MRGLILVVLVFGLLVEMTLRLAVFLAISATGIGLIALIAGDAVEPLVRPSLYPLVTEALEV